MAAAPCCISICRSPLALPAGSDREYPPMSQFLELARQQAGVHVDIEKPFWWDMPVWVALGMVDSIELAHNHMWRDGMLDNEAWGKPRDKVFYPSPRGTGYWSQDIYYHLLNCGLRIPPSAGSASGVLDNPVGYNRVYVHCGETLTYDAWWEGLRAGRVVVTNGPLLRPRVNGELPGHVFQGKLGEVIELSVQAGSCRCAIRSTTWKSCRTARSCMRCGWRNIATGKGPCRP